MANGFFHKARAAALSAALDVAGGDVKLLLIDTGAYSVDLTNDEFVSDIPGAAILARSGTIGSITVVDGAILGDPGVFTAPAAGDDYGAVILFIDTGVDGTSQLVIWDDTATAGLPGTTDGSDITVTPNAGGNGYGKI